MADIKIDATTLAILSTLIWSGPADQPLAVIPSQLPPETYQKVDQVLKNLGGRWKVKKGHQFDCRGRDNVQSAIETKIAPDFKKRLQAFYTPQAVAELLFEGRLLEDYEVLEPEAGGGMLARMAREAGAKVTCNELDPYEANRLSREFTTTCGDFLKLKPDPKYNCVFMNPPFNKGLDLKHVRHALKFLQTPGSLHAIISANPDHKQLQEIAAEYGLDEVELEYVEAGAFKESGTDVSTKILRVFNNCNKSRHSNTMNRLRETIDLEISNGNQYKEITTLINKLGSQKSDLPGHCHKEARRYMQENFPNEFHRDPHNTTNFFLSDDQRQELEQEAYEVLRKIALDNLNFYKEPIPQIWKNEIHEEKQRKAEAAACKRNALAQEIQTSEKTNENQTPIAETQIIDAPTLPTPAAANPRRQPTPQPVTASSKMIQGDLFAA